MKVWKFAIPMANTFELSMPDGAEMLTVQVQKGAPCLWALVDPARPTHPFLFRVAGTGHEITEQVDRYVGSFQLYEGAFVGHVFLLVREVEE